jgi:uncharacterized protein (TIGR02588 family)
MEQSHPNGGNGREAEQGARAKTPWLEWIASGVGLLLTLGVFGVIGWQALDNPSAPPAIVVAVERVVQVEGGYRVDVRASNRTGSAAAQVEVEGRLLVEGEEPSTSRAVFDYIPGRSSREGGLFFARDPRQGELSVRPLGYSVP